MTQVQSEAKPTVAIPAVTKAELEKELSGLREYCRQLDVRAGQLEQALAQAVEVMLCGARPEGCLAWLKKVKNGTPGSIPRG